MTDSTRTFLVPKSKTQDVIKKIEKLNKRAEKLNIDSFIYWQEDAEPVNHNGTFYQMVNFFLAGPFEVKCDGWRFIATIQHLETGENVVRRVDEDVIIPENYRIVGKSCDHCNINRYRKDTYLVADEEDNIKHVGSTCMKDFLGGNSADKAIQNANIVSEIKTFMDGVSKQFGTKDTCIDVVRVIAITKAIVDKNGWVSKSKAKLDQKTSTASLVEDYLFDRPFIDVTEKHIEFAKKASDWIENMQDEDVERSEYLFNIRAIARAGFVPVNLIGYAASICSAYMRENKETDSSEFVGNLNEKITSNMKFHKKLQIDSQYGVFNIYSFRDNLGNLFVWKTPTEYDLNESSDYIVKGTVKSHESFRGVKQTVLTRCSINDNKNARQ